MYSFRYKTEVNIFPEETLHSSLNSETLASSDPDGPLKTEHMNDTRSCSQGNEADQIQESDTSEKTEDQNGACTEVSAKVEEEIEIIMRRHVEECIVIKEDTSITKSVNIENRSCNNDFENIETQEKFSNVEEELISKSTVDSTSNISEVREVHSIVNVEGTSSFVSEKEVILEETESKEKFGKEPNVESQKPRRVFRGDSRDSGIGDCMSNFSTSSQHVNELGISSIIEEEVDNENNNGNLKDVHKGTEQLEQRRFSDKLTDSSQKRESTNVAASGVTKASRETNRHEGVFYV